MRRPRDLPAQRLARGLRCRRSPPLGGARSPPRREAANGGQPHRRVRRRPRLGSPLRRRHLCRRTPLTAREPCPRRLESGHAERLPRRLVPLCGGPGKTVLAYR
ncbi:hypothetical protein SLNWT_3574 [Streptomyces albus]|uniref:Uncharacterized protein n=1 Tax=Streptomyces albus (strain ATCC 21838 / DSM 41398 / FERM P-419 / JCM 4703 / NBRC 107858) TaxID=1081613 RepID=A0A0B5EXJ7_STRA4|nr:hypothetical protein SLNWT_3574 [Streptomyces albus]